MPQTAQRRRELYAKRKSAAADDPMGPEALKRQKMLEADRARKAASRPTAALQLAYENGSREEAMKLNIELRKKSVRQAKERRETSRENLRRIEAASRAGDEDAAASLAELVRKKATAAEKRHIWRRNRRVRTTQLYVYTALEKVKLDFQSALTLSDDPEARLDSFRSSGEHSALLNAESDPELLWNALFAFRHKSQEDGPEWYRQAWAWFLSSRRDTLRRGNGEVEEAAATLAGEDHQKVARGSAQDIWRETVLKLLSENLWRGLPLICKKKARQEWPNLDSSSSSFPSYIINLDEDIPEEGGCSLNACELKQLTQKVY